MLKYSRSYWLIDFNCVNKYYLVITTSVAKEKPSVDKNSKDFTTLSWHYMHTWLLSILCLARYCIYYPVIACIGSTLCVGNYPIGNLFSKLSSINVHYFPFYSFCSFHLKYLIIFLFIWQVWPSVQLPSQVLPADWTSSPLARWLISFTAYQ